MSKELAIEYADLLAEKFKEIGMEHVSSGPEHHNAKEEYIDAKQDGSFTYFTYDNVRYIIGVWFTDSGALGPGLYFTEVNQDTPDHHFDHKDPNAFDKIIKLLEDKHGKQIAQTTQQG